MFREAVRDPYEFEYIVTNENVPAWSESKVPRGESHIIVETVGPVRLEHFPSWIAKISESILEEHGLTVQAVAYNGLKVTHYEHLVYVKVFFRTVRI